MDRNGLLVAAAVGGGLVVDAYHRLCGWWSPPPLCSRAPADLGELCLAKITDTLAESHSNRVAVGVCCGLICLVVSVASLVLRFHAFSFAHASPRFAGEFFLGAGAEETAAADERFALPAFTRKGPRVARAATGGLEALNAIQPFEGGALYKPRTR